MRFFIIIGSLLVTGGYLPVSQAKVSCEANGALCATVNASAQSKTQYRKLCVLSSEGFEPVWYLWSGHGLPERLQSIPDSMMLVTNILISPRQQWLAIESVGEGHPYITVVELASVLNKAPLKTQVEINPYPGWASLVHWQSQGNQEQLIIKSDRLLSEKNQDLYQVQEFAVSILTGKITARSLALQQLIPYYIRLLSQADKPIEEIVTTLINLVDTDAEQKLLQQWFTKTTDPVIKAQLAKVLKQVTSVTSRNNRLNN
jgi:hypothetical protein